MTGPPVSRVYAAQAGTPETALPKGDVTEGVVRVGDTVRRPHLPPAWRGIDQGGRLRLFADAYGLSRAERLALPDLGIDRADIA